MGIPKDPIKYELWKKHQRESQIGVKRSEEFKTKRKNIMLLKYQDPEERKKQSERMCGEKNPFFGKQQPEYVLEILRKPKSESHKNKLSESSKKDFEKVERMKNIAKNNKGKKLTEEHRMNLILSHNDIWYGSETLKKYNNGESREGYCLTWNEELRERIRGNWNYKSVLSGLTKEDNLIKGKPVALTCHHVYYQKKACCEWDEDTSGYYAMINLGTRRNPNFIRHDIKGDPNKFVTLTHAEHTRVQRNDKLKWILLFEELIEQHGGISYLPKLE